MARIRSIHPSILTDPEFASALRDGRILFIYTWIIADDAGNLERSRRGLKMACFPSPSDADLTDEKIAELTDLLITERFYQPYEFNGKQYLHIRTFHKYQKPDHPTAPKFPLYPGQEYTFHVRQGNSYVPKIIRRPSSNDSTNIPRTLPELTGSVLTGEELERRGKELERTGEEMDRELLVVPPGTGVGVIGTPPPAGAPPKSQANDRIKTKSHCPAPNCFYPGSIKHPADGKWYCNVHIPE